MMYLFSQLLVVDAVVLHNRKRKELNLNLCLSLSLSCSKRFLQLLNTSVALLVLFYIFKALNMIPLPPPFHSLFCIFSFMKISKLHKPICSAKFGNLLWNDVFSDGQVWWWTTAGIKRKEIPAVRFLLLPHAASTCCQIFCGEAWDLHPSGLRMTLSPEQQRLCYIKRLNNNLVVT